MLLSFPVASLLYYLYQLTVDFLMRKFNIWNCYTGGIPCNRVPLCAPESNLPCHKEQSADLGPCFYTPVANEVIGKPEFNDLDGCVNYFGNSIIYIAHVMFEQG